MLFLTNNWLGFFITSLLIFIFAIGCIIYGLVEEKDNFLLLAFGIFSLQLFFIPMAFLAVVARFAQFIVIKS